MPTFDEVMGLINDPEISKEELLEAFKRPEIVIPLLEGLTPEEKTDVVIAKNVKVFDGDINKYVEDFITHTTTTLEGMPEGPAKETTKTGQRKLLERILTKEGLTDETKGKINNALGSPTFAAAAGGKHKKTRRHVKRRRGRKSRANLKRVNT